MHGCVAGGGSDSSGGGAPRGGPSPVSIPVAPWRSSNFSDAHSGNQAMLLPGSNTPRTGGKAIPTWLMQSTDRASLSGGVNRRADRKRLYVVKADGSVSLPGRSGWFKRRNIQVEPGDTIIVPLDIERRRALTVWSEASAIIYQLALGAAAVNSF